MNAGFLLIPLLFFRYGILYLLGKGSLQRAAHYPPFFGNERIALWVYQIASAAMMLFLLFLKIRLDTLWFGLGLAVFLAGAVLCAVSAINFAKPGGDGVNRNGLYRLSRNPMYVSYFIYFMGCVLLTQSWVLLIILLTFQISSHWLILSEERWCIKEYGQGYLDYMKQVRRYL